MVKTIALSVVVLLVSSVAFGQGILAGATQEFDFNATLNGLFMQGPSNGNGGGGFEVSAPLISSVQTISGVGVGAIQSAGIMLTTEGGGGGIGATIGLNQTVHGNGVLPPVGLFGGPQAGQMQVLGSNVGPMGQWQATAFTGVQGITRSAGAGGAGGENEITSGLSQIGSNNAGGLIQVGALEASQESHVGGGPLAVGAVTTGLVVSTAQLQLLNN